METISRVRINRYLTSMKISINQLRRIIKEEVQTLTEAGDPNKIKFEEIKQSLVDFLQSNGELVSGDVVLQGNTIKFHIYDQDAPDLQSQPAVKITLELEPSTAQLRDENPEVFL